MKIAITGGTGFVGRYIVKRMASAGHACSCWRRPDSNMDDLPVEADWIFGSLNDASTMAPLVEGCDVVIHSALFRPDTSIVGFRGAEGDIPTFLEANFLGTIRLIEAARAAGVPRFVFLSTCAVHEEILSDRPLDEAHPLWPKTHYGAHKAALEKFVHSYGLGMGYEICALRPSGVYGVRAPVGDSKWFELIHAVANGKTVECTKGGKEVHAADVARACEILLTAEGIAGQAYSCCDQYISEFDVATITKEITGSQATIIGGPRKPKHSIVTDKLQGTGMKFGGEELLRQTIEELVSAAC